MPITVETPAVPALPGDTLLGQRVICAFRPAGGSQINFRARVASHSRETETLDRLVAIGGATKRPDRAEIIRANESIRLEVDEFGGDAGDLLLGAASRGQARIWVLDPRESGEVTLRSAPVDARGVLDGDLPINDETYSQANFRLTILSPGGLQWTRPGVVPENALGDFAGEPLTDFAELFLTDFST